MFEIGRLCVKIAGRDARLKCVVVETLDKFYVTIDGQTRRRKCNINHLEPLDKVLKLSKGASHDEVVKALKAEGIEIKEKSPKKDKPAMEKQVKGPHKAKPKADKKATASKVAEKPKKETKPEKKAETVSVEKSEKTKKKAAKKD